MTEILQTPVNIGPIPVDVVKLPEQGDAFGYLLLLMVVILLIVDELRDIAKDKRREP